MDIVEEARKFEENERKKYKIPSEIQVKVSEEKAVEFARKLGADESIARIGAILMDVYLGRALAEGKVEQHTALSAEAAKNFLDKFKLPNDFKKKVINCVEAHHAKVPFICKEAEICANADCFKFLDPTAFLDSIINSGRIGRKIDEIVKIMKYKIEEKRKIISLEICKPEAEKNYKIIKDFLNQVKV